MFEIKFETWKYNRNFKRKCGKCALLKSKISVTICYWTFFWEYDHVQRAIIKFIIYRNLIKFTIYNDNCRYNYLIINLILYHYIF